MPKHIRAIDGVQYLCEVWYDKAFERSVIRLSYAAPKYNPVYVAAPLDPSHTTEQAALGRQSLVHTLNKAHKDTLHYDIPNAAFEYLRGTNYLEYLRDHWD